ncbi:calcium-binding protein [Aliiroseovarius sp.]|uniref:calcium-binding protein n=1 Tax=Aliiroseovarius sp. TaxID=1872442 RepID=UPI003BA866FF
MADITFSTLVAGTAPQTDLVASDHFGINHSSLFERVSAPGDDAGWYKFDDIVQTLELTDVRWPGGAYSEIWMAIVDPDPTISGDEYLDPNATTVTSRLTGATDQVQGLDTFAEGLKQVGDDIGITVVLPTGLFGPTWKDADSTYQNLVNPDWNAFANQWTDIDTGSDQYSEFQRVVEDYVYRCLEAVEGNARIEAFELGNEYEAIFGSRVYGQIADAMAQFTHNAIQQNNADKGADADPNILVQIWANTSGSGMSIEELHARNLGVLAQFSEAALSLIDGVVPHNYYDQDHVIGTPEDASQITESYDSIPDLMALYRAMADEWNLATGKDLELVISEWNVGHKPHVPEADWFVSGTNTVTQTFIDGTTLGLKQLAPLMELFSAMMVEGVDAAHVWSALNNTNSIGRQGNELLTVVGAFFETLKQKSLGRSYVELGVDSDTYDAHLFAGADSSTLFVSNLESANGSVSIDLGALGVSDGSFELTVLGVHDADGNFTGDGAFRAYGQDFEGVPEWLEHDASLVPRVITVEVVAGVAEVPLGAHEIAVLDLDIGYVDGQLVLPPPPAVVDPDAVPEGGETATILLDPENTRTDGTSGDDIIIGDERDEDLRGGGGDDILHDGAGKDSLRGDSGRDIFRLTADNDHETIRDFQLDDFNGQVERVDISAFGIASWDEINTMLSSNSTGSHKGFYFDEAKGRLYLHLGDGTRVEFRFDKNDLVDADGALLLGKEHFIFAGSVSGGDTGGGDTGGGDTGGGDTGDYNVIQALEEDSQTKGTKENDQIIGSDGRDDLRGENGDDRLIDGDGNDVLRGGNGADTFVFTSAGDKEVIADFNQGDDVIDLSAFNLSGWDALADGFTVQHDTNDPNKSRVYLWFDTDGDGVDDTRIEFRHKEGKHEIVDESGRLLIDEGDFLF